MYKLQIKQFKCFEKVEIPINQLTVMAGANGVGKSTAVQSLLMLRSTIESSELIEEEQILVKTVSLNSNIALNGNFCLALGNTSHVLNRNFKDDEILLGLESEKQKIEINYKVDTIKPELFILADWFSSTQNLNENPILKKEFYYLNAERNGPRIQQSLSYQLFPHAGWQGENVAQLLQKMEFEKAFENRNVKDKNQKFVKDRCRHKFYSKTDIR